MALKKSHLYSSLWKSCDELRGGMDASQYKDYVLTLLFMKYVSDRYAGKPGALVVVPDGGGFDDMIACKGDKEIGDRLNKIIARLAEANDLKGVIDQADFNDEGKLGAGKEMVDRLTKLVAIFENLDLGANRAGGDDLLGDAYEYLMRHFATESGKSKGQFYTPAEVSRIMARVIGIGRARERHQPTVFDPTCGSGSLLLKAADEAAVENLAIYGQEKDVATWALARMNMILHGHPTAELERGNTLAAPGFTDDAGNLKRFDFAVANPPFSDKAWSNGVQLDDDPFQRFEPGVPPAKNGDYAYLLHFIRSLRTDGAGAIILPLGVLFRGHREAVIRRDLVRRGLISGIIGLPPNLFYGTGIPACIVVIDKQNAAARTGIFLVDASRGFAKDGAKNRLRERDIHRIVDVFTNRREERRYSRMVPLAEIESEANDCNLSIPRYINSSEPEDLHDLNAHLNGGIPERDIDALQQYWDVFPDLRDDLVETAGRPGYVRLRVEPEKLRSAILGHPEFERFAKRVWAAFESWYAAHQPALESIDPDTRPADLIRDLSEDVLAKFADVPLLDPYDLYQRLLDYWAEVFQDDVHLIAAEGWKKAGRGLRLAEKGETPDLALKNGRKTVKYVADLLPASTLIVRFFALQRAELELLEKQHGRAEAERAALEEEEGGDEGALAGLEGKSGITKRNVQNRVMDLREAALKSFAPETSRYRQAAAIRKTTFGTKAWTRGTEDPDGLFRELDALHVWLGHHAVETKLKKSLAARRAELQSAAYSKYAGLTTGEVKSLTVEDKWLDSLGSCVDIEVEAMFGLLADRLGQLAIRYAEPLPIVELDAETLATKVGGHLTRMGLTWG